MWQLREMLDFWKPIFRPSILVRLLSELLRTASSSDYKPFTPITGGNAPWHVLFGFESSMVTSTIVRGRVLMHDRQLLTIDEHEAIAFASELAPKVWERYNQLANAL
ncbi:MAG UNVERIFIED_CONTAM: hypothetical protein LVT10_12290 [Anaerolineae bacterium]